MQDNTILHPKKEGKYSIFQHPPPSIPSAGPDTYPIPPVLGYTDALPTPAGRGHRKYAGLQFSSLPHSWRKSMPDKSFFSYYCRMKSGYRLQITPKISKIRRHKCAY